MVWRAVVREVEDTATVEPQFIPQPPLCCPQPTVDDPHAPRPSHPSTHPPVSTSEQPIAKNTHFYNNFQIFVTFEFFQY